MNKNDILDKAKTIINGERQGTYGHAEDSFGVIAKLWSAFLGKELSSADVANMMILMKVARNSSGVYKDDNWIDICGYAALGGEIQDSKNTPKQSSGVFHLADHRFALLSEAHTVLIKMKEILNDTGEVTVSDYYELANIPITQASYEYGWKSLSGAVIYPIAIMDEYIIKFPEPQKL